MPGGRLPLTGFLVARDDGGGIEDSPWSVIYPANTFSANISNLKTGTYTVSVTPQNRRGSGPASTVTLQVMARPLPPPAASTYGYTTLRMNDDFTSPETIDFAGTAQAGQGIPGQFNSHSLTIHRLLPILQNRCATPY